MAPKAPQGGKKAKDASSSAAQAGSKGKAAKKKKWSKGKTKEKANNMVLFDPETYDKLMKEAAKIKFVSPSVLSERLRINGSLARRALRELVAKDKIKVISQHASQVIATRAIADEKAEEAAAEAPATAVDEDEE